ncbi:MAG: hypothetical protein HY823_08210 [Acidobacteria bacterium]|nr:hypothetical protein [Acidobacteriota bacterium]
MRPSLPLLLALALPALAQGFPDDPAFGGSRVFSQGYSPLGNSACFDQAPPGWYVGVIRGDLKPKDQTAAMEPFRGGFPSDATLQAQALSKLGENPWAVRRGSAGLSLSLAGGVHGSYTRESLTGLLAVVDLDPAHRGAPAATALNTTFLEQRRFQVDRLVMGVGSMEGGTAYGVSLRAENWRYGSNRIPLNPPLGPIGFGDPDRLLDFSRTEGKRFAATLDAGVVFQLAPGLRLGALVDRVVSATLGDLKEQPQTRVGLQVDLGGGLAVSGEADLNEAVRVPVAEKQRSTSASLRIPVGASLLWLLGAERRTVGRASSTSFGTTLLLRAGAFHIGAGMRFGQDRPLTGLGFRFE